MKIFYLSLAIPLLSYTPTFAPGANEHVIISTVATPDWKISTIMKMTTPAELIKAYGQKNVSYDVTIDHEGNETGKAYFVKDGKESILEVGFNKKGVTHATTNSTNSKWVFPFGLKVGTPLATLVNVNVKDFYVYGFEWDYSGMLKNWNGGKLFNSGILIFLGTTEGQYNSPGYTQLLAAQTAKRLNASEVVFKTDHPLMKKAGLVIEEIWYYNPANK